MKKKNGKRKSPCVKRLCEWSVIGTGPATTTERKKERKTVREREREREREKLDDLRLLFGRQALRRCGHCDRKSGNAKCSQRSINWNLIGFNCFVFFLLIFFLPKKINSHSLLIEPRPSANSNRCQDAID